MRSTLLTCLSIGLAASLAAVVTGVEASPRATRSYAPAPLELRVPVQGKELLSIAQPAKPQPSDAHQVTQRAFSMIGTPYRWGGTSPKGFDCSGLVKYVFRDVDDVELPRTARAIYQSSNPKVARRDLQPGDLVFFRIRSRNVDHVGIYVGNDRFVHAPRRGQKVKVANLNDKYWQRHYLAAKRVLPETLAKADLPGNRFE
ncbi:MULTISPECIES: C40 family peptidase [Pseudomonas]|uniref:Cell wall-associated hydrolase, NlpC family n=1 Tax=Pseudomonas delhiensis TaxID=366289 RepID=A0A239MJM5_9PSED|nr:MULTISPECIES: C40 family peptidase [Pseudomonas]MED5612030.1 C40 family peptidase [Pseudomonas sp. JH-2]PWU27893.1 peptidoglycan endopeptidase [Pseudomonas sp. RW407]SDJ62572.1 Cell wall-associated hydrolase, NlpC family [Pseudomonas delhiensis]SNT42473.1 Cell wall-associated hydrolase, NlpC family [Pseudomonas delhiensis]